MNGVPVAGATGQLGTFVSKEFKERGAWVLVLTRRPDKLKRLEPFLEPVITGWPTPSP